MRDPKAKPAAFPALPALAAALLLLLVSCSDGDDGEEFDFERQPQGFRAETDGPDDSLFLVLAWEPPANVEGLVAYHLWAVLAEETGEIAGFVSRQTGFRDDAQERNLPAGVRHWSVPADSADGSVVRWTIPPDVAETVSSLSLGAVRWLLWAEYSGSKTPGSRVSTRVYYRDVFPPEPVSAEATPFADSVLVEWDRPFDLADNLEPNRPGRIFGYRVRFSVLTGDFVAKKPRFAVSRGFGDDALLLNKSLDPLGGVELTKERIVDAPPTDEEYSFVLLDGKTWSGTSPDSNRLGFVARNLKPNQDYLVRIVPYDSLGVLRDLEDNMAEVRDLRFSTTDASEPAFAPAFRLVATDAVGAWILSWKPASDAESGIESYLFVRIDADTAEGRADTLKWSAKADTLEPVSGRLAQLLKNLVPGVEVSVSVAARDSSGHLSRPADTTFSLPPQTSLACPAGTVGVQGADSLPDFCMDRFEHREDGKFVVQVRWSEARAACQGLSDGEWTFDLCSEAQWTRACTEGTGRNWGVLETDEELLPRLLVRECGVGTGDPDASADVSLRSLSCATGAGARDLPGHYQEWVVGPAADSMRIKGGSWMRPNGADQTTALSLASCGARASGIWSRPKFVLRDGHDTLFVFYGDSTRFSVPANDTAMRRRVSDTLVWNPADSVQAYAVYADSSSSELLGRDTLVHYPTREGWAEANANGLDYRKEGSPVPAFVYGTRQVSPGDLYQHRSVGFRCCALPSGS